MREQRGAFVMAVSHFGAEAIGQKCVSARGVNKKPRSPATHAVFAIPRGHLDSIVMAKFDCCGSHALANKDTSALSISEKYLIKLRSLDLKGRRRRRVQCVREICYNVSIVARQSEVRASFDNTNSANLLHDSQFIENRQIAR
jgi:hypothetical protein